MDEYTRNSIDIRKKTIDDYYLIPDDVKTEVEDLFKEMEALGESCSDVSEFETKFAAGPLNERYMSIFAKLKPNPAAVAGAMKDSVKERWSDPKQVASDIADETEYVLKSAMQPLRHEAYEKRREFMRENVPGYEEIRQVKDTAQVLGKLFGRKKPKATGDDESE
jgi:hypothetical protein